MFGITATSSSADEQAALTIISLLADDNKYKQRFDELKALAEAAQKARDDAATAEKVAAEENINFAAAKAEAEKKIKDAEDLMRAAATQLQAGADKQLELSAYAKRLDEKAIELKAQADTAFKDREAALVTNEATAKEREATVAASEAKLVAAQDAQAKHVAEQEAQNAQALALIERDRLEVKADAAALVKVREELHAAQDKVRAALGGL